ncbi:hypothetical protein AK812_SmicGene8622 [Symbiodinium microadriaticum]|uniref:Uncharacterized protein n=1 Tax=Symbiodinium microadriaticum TaxID=2951 RepID=A0A1Q9EKF3_SYMMI|nr:hypothetical protein AK812_SmicGene8622 [Symbiodinium microadriaticum]
MAVVTSASTIVSNSIIIIISIIIVIAVMTSVMVTVMATTHITVVVIVIIVISTIGMFTIMVFLVAIVLAICRYRDSYPHLRSASLLIIIITTAAATDTVIITCIANLQIGDPGNCFNYFDKVIQMKLPMILIMMALHAEKSMMYNMLLSTPKRIVIVTKHRKAVTFQDKLEKMNGVRCMFQGVDTKRFELERFFSRQGGSPVLEMAQDFEGLLTSGNSVGRMALQDALWAAYCQTDTPPVPPRFRHFVVNGSVCNARRFQEKGFDVQLLGFARCQMTKEGELDEDSCYLDGVREGYQVLLHLLKILEEQTQQSSEPAESEHIEPKIQAELSQVSASTPATLQHTVKESAEQEELLEGGAEPVEPAEGSELEHGSGSLQPTAATPPATAIPSSRPLAGRRATSLEDLGAPDSRAEGGREAGRPSVAMLASTSVGRSFPTAPVPRRASTERSQSDFDANALVEDSAEVAVVRSEEIRPADSPQGGEDAWFSWLGALYG